MYFNTWSDGLIRVWSPYWHIRLSVEAPVVGISLQLTTKTANHFASGVAITDTGCQMT